MSFMVPKCDTLLKFAVVYHIEICVSLSDLSFSNSKLKVEVDNFVMYLIF